MGLGCLFTQISVIWLFSALLNKCSLLFIQLFLVYCLTYCSIIFNLGLFVWIVCDYQLFYITVFNCLWLYQAVIHEVCPAIVRDFGWSVGRSVHWSCFCKLFLTIGSSNCKQSKTKSTFLIDYALVFNHPPWVHLRA